MLYFTRSLFLILSAVAMTVVTEQSSAVESPSEKGLKIAQEMKARNVGWGDSQGDMTMTLRDRKGRAVVREMRTKSLEIEGDGDKGLTIFDTPLDVKGTAFLSFSHIEGDDDQWLFLPALKRVKRIASRNKSGPFLGSEFAFEDLSSFEVAKNTYTYLRDEDCDELNCFVVEMDPVDKFSGYTRVVAWVDQDHYRVHKIEFYDRRDTHLKTLTIEGYQLYKNKYWRADKQMMLNHKNGKTTDIEIKNIRFDTGLTEADFNEKKLARAR